MRCFEESTKGVWQRNKKWFLSCPLSSVFNVSWFVVFGTGFVTSLLKRSWAVGIRNWTVGMRGLGLLPGPVVEINSLLGDQKKIFNFLRLNLMLSCLPCEGLKFILTKKCRVRTNFQAAHCPCGPQWVIFTSPERSFILRAVSWWKVWYSAKPFHSFLEFLDSCRTAPARIPRF